MSYAKAEKWLSKEFDKYVPSSGKCETMYGEIIRATNRIGYRWFNDGDVIGVGYGNETCNPAARFLMMQLTGTDIATAIRSIWGDEWKYEENLKNLIVQIVDYLQQNKETLVAKAGEDMFDYFDSNEDRDDSYDEEDEYDDYYEDEEDEEDY